MKKDNHYISIPREEYEERENFYKEMNNRIKKLQSSKNMIWLYSQEYSIDFIDRFDGTHGRSKVMLPKVLLKDDSEVRTDFENAIREVRDIIKSHNDETIELKKYLHKERAKDFKEKTGVVQELKSQSNSNFYVFLSFVVGLILGVIISSISY